MIRRGLGRHFYYRPEITVEAANVNLEISRGARERARSQINNFTWKAVRQANTLLRTYVHVLFVLSFLLEIARGSRN